MLYRARAATIQEKTWHVEAGMLLLLGALLLAMLPGVAHASSVMRQKILDEGRQDFEENCVACHGADGSGTGELSQRLVRPAKDLRGLSARNGGTYPFWRIFEIISGEQAVEGHQTFQMPLYSKRMRGDDFKPGYLPTHVRILELTHYLESIQQKK